MSANENETLTDIISEIRAAAPFQTCPKLVMRLADRIEAAWKRERDELIYSFDPTKAGRSKAPDPTAYSIEGMKGFEEWKRNKEQSVGNVAAKREIPQPDPDWKTICEKCKDGEILPDNCEYFGEPNGCNSPTYGEHPPVYNAAAMREALVKIWDKQWSILPKNKSESEIMSEITTIIEEAFLAPLRNCDRFSAAQLKEMFENEMVVYLTKEATDRDREIARVTANGVIDALFAPSTDQRGD